jgi:hypothetical protein
MGFMQKPKPKDTVQTISRPKLQEKKLSFLGLFLVKKKKKNFLSWTFSLLGVQTLERTYMSDNSFLYVPGKLMSVKIVCKPTENKRFFRTDVNCGAFFQRYLFEVNGKKIPTITNITLFTGDDRLSFSKKIYTKITDDNDCHSFVEFSGIVLGKSKDSLGRLVVPFMFSGFDKVGSLVISEYTNL